MACKPEREGAPNTRLQLTVAMHFGAREGGGESRESGALGRPQLKRHPLGDAKRWLGSIALVSWILGAAVSGLENPSVPDYGSLGSQVQAVYGEVLAWEDSTRCGGACDSFAGGAVPLLKVRVIRPFSRGWKGDVVFEVPFADAPYPHPETMEVGQRVVITFVAEKSSEWACGNLRSCKVTPRPNPRVLEIFRVYQWP